MPTEPKIHDEVIKLGVLERYPFIGIPEVDDRINPLVLRAARFQSAIAEQDLSYLDPEKGDLQAITRGITSLRPYDPVLQSHLERLGIKDPDEVSNAISVGLMGQDAPVADITTILDRLISIAPDMDVDRVLTSMLSGILRGSVQSSRTQWEWGGAAKSWSQSLESKKYRVTDYVVGLLDVPDFQLHFKDVVARANSDSVSIPRERRIKDLSEAGKWNLTFQDVSTIIRNHIWLINHENSYRTVSGNTGIKVLQDLEVVVTQSSKFTFPQKVEDFQTLWNVLTQQMLLSKTLSLREIKVSCDQQQHEHDGEHGYLLENGDTERDTNRTHVEYKKIAWMHEDALLGPNVGSMYVLNIANAEEVSAQIADESNPYSLIAINGC